MSGTEDFIDSIMDKDFNSAEGTFANMMQDRIADALGQQKIAVAGTMFGEPEDNAEDLDDDDIEWDEDEDEESEDLENEEES
tara:strand:+ start:587 stop:832 length:246 start_codon:yes stop_codon:yes gene_type:complete